jgi:hypothetical protein
LVTLSLGTFVPARLRLPFRRSATSVAALILTRSPTKRSFASSFRSQSAALTLGTRAKVQLGHTSRVSHCVRNAPPELLRKLEECR